MDKRSFTFFLFVVAFLILLHQFAICGKWFELNDIHHETFAIAFASFGLGIWMGAKKK